MYSSLWYSCVCHLDEDLFYMGCAAIMRQF